MSVEIREVVSQVHGSIVIQFFVMFLSELRLVLEKAAWLFKTELKEHCILLPPTYIG
jgi:hypothetical protein